MVVKALKLLVEVFKIKFSLDYIIKHKVVVWISINLVLLVKMLPYNVQAFLKCLVSVVACLSQVKALNILVLASTDQNLVINWRHDWHLCNFLQ